MTEKAETSAGADVSAAIDDVLKRSEKVCGDIIEEAFEVDWLGKDPGYAAQRCWEEGLHRLSIPQEYGGLSNGVFNFATWELIQVIVNVSAGDGSAGQNLLTEMGVLRQLFDADVGLPEPTLRQLAEDKLTKNLRFVASNAGVGQKHRVVARRVPDGVVVSGTKTFNSNSGADGYANVLCVLEGDDSPAPCFALVPLGHRDVTKLDDWDNMGQRGTCSQTITYDDVFVPDGWHYRVTKSHSAALPTVYLLHAALLIGIGIGAFDTTLTHIRKTNRPSFPEFEDAATDPLLRRQVGALSVKLASAEALLSEVARRVGELRPDDSPHALMVEAFKAKVACVDASLEVTGELHSMTGARSTSNAYRYDRFWRNARTFGVHDSTEGKLYLVGGWELTGKPPVLPLHKNA